MSFLKQHRRRRVAAQPFPARWAEILRANFPPYELLDAAPRRRLEQHIQIFVREKKFEGCAGLEITDEIRITIAAQACLLILNRTSDCYPEVKSILVYPEAFTDPHQSARLDGRAREGGRLGEAWQQDLVILSWKHVLAGAQHHDHGRNVTVHEFAHQLDLEDGAFDGVPMLPPPVRYGVWVKAMQTELESLRASVRQGADTLIDRYGATNATEFFAVLTELFFENPQALKEKRPELYELLRLYFNLDPLTLQPAAQPDPTAAKPVTEEGDAGKALKEGERLLQRMLWFWWGIMAFLAVVVMRAPAETIFAAWPFDLLLLGILALALVGHHLLRRRQPTSADGPPTSSSSGNQTQ